MRAEVLFLTALLTIACRQDMHDQPKYEPLTASSFFPNGQSARLPIEGTVAQGQLRADEAFYTGRVGDIPVTELPVQLTAEVLDRGRSRYDIFCAPCHGRVGDGQGMIVQRGFRSPPSFHLERMREAPVGHYFDAITRGFGAMASYASRIKTEDRWAIIAYVRALQLSQGAALADVPASQREQLGAGQ